jgi:hypothetical protein
MAIAIVINDEGIVTPIVEGTVLRILTKDGTAEDHPNPALDVTEGRRGATLRKAIELGANSFVAPPATFCELSYEKAQQQQVTFINIAANQPFTQVVQQIKSGAISASANLPAEEVVPSAPVAK